MYEMTIQLNGDSGKRLYEQIYEHISQEIKVGKLLQGEKLPSTRSLAEYLQISRSTVDYAYMQLLSEGYIESRPYKGYYVCKMEDLFRLRTEIEEIHEKKIGQGNLASASYEHKFNLHETNALVDKNESSFFSDFDFSPNGIDMSEFPFGVWKKISKTILTDHNSELFLQGNAQGDYSLRATISRYLHASRGVNCSPEQIIIGAGNDYLLMLLEKIFGRKIRIAMENPTYTRAYKIFQSFHYPICPVAMDEYGMRVEQLEEKEVSVAYIMPSHQFPSGCVMPIGRRTELLNWANVASERYVIEDDYDSEFRYKGKPIPSLQSLDKNGKVIYMGTFSKSIAPTIRVSYMVLPQNLLKQYHSNCYFYSTTVSRIDQKILDEFIRGGYFERHLNKMRKVYKSKHDLLLDCLEPFHREYRISGENAGLHILIEKQKELSAAVHQVKEEELVRKAREKGIKVYGLSEYYIDNQVYHPPTILLGYGGLTMEQIIEGANKLKKAWL